MSLLRGEPVAQCEVLSSLDHTSITDISVLSPPDLTPCPYDNMMQVMSRAWFFSPDIMQINLEFIRPLSLKVVMCQLQSCVSH